MLDLNKLEQYRENNRIEAKKALGGLPHSIWETYSAFANALGGILLLGVEEYRDKSLHTVDLPDPERMVQEFWTLVNDPKTASVNLLTMQDVQIEEVNGDRIIVITVPQASRYDKPVYVEGDPIAGCYRRSGEGDHRCTLEEREAMLRQAAVRTADMRVLPELDESVFCRESLRSFRRRLRSLRPGHVLDGLSDRDFLIALGAAETVEGRLCPTGAGLLFFGRAEAIRRACPHFALRYQELRGGEWLDCLSTGDVGRSGNVYDFYFAVQEQLSQALPGEDPSVAKALEEALVNCLVNADYESRQGVEIRRSARQISMCNPGDFRIALDDARSGGRSDPRNANLMKYFHLLNLGQGLGGGIPGIFNAWKQQGWQEPRILEEPEPPRVTLLLPLEKQGRTRQAKNRSAGKGAIRKAARKEQIIQYLTDRASAREEELISLLGIQAPGAKAVLRQLLAEDILTVEVRGKDKLYKLKA